MSFCRAHNNFLSPYHTEEVLSLSKGHITHAVCDRGASTPNIHVSGIISPVIASWRSTWSYWPGWKGQERSPVSLWESQPKKTLQALKKINTNVSYVHATWYWPSKYKMAAHTLLRIGWVSLRIWCYDLWFQLDVAFIVKKKIITWKYWILAAQRESFFHLFSVMLGTWNHEMETSLGDARSVTTKTNFWENCIWTLDHF